MGWIGTTALAAHQIALQIASMLFMVPFGISLAATVRVGHAVGRRDPPAIAPRRLCARSALGTVFMAGDDADGDRGARHAFRCCFSAATRASAETARLAATLLLVGATFFVTDGLQGIAAGALRGLNDTRVPMLFAGISFWVDRLPQRLCAGISGRPRRHRHLDRLLGRGRDLRDAAGLALRTADAGAADLPGVLSVRWTR